jgi:DNA-binding GntR family transcriptional regulator
VGLTRDFENEGFLQHSPGREFQVQGHGLDNTSGLLALRAVVQRVAIDEIVTLGAKHGLRLHASFDDAHSDLALVETMGLLNYVEHLAKDLVALGFHRLPDPK